MPDDEEDIDLKDGNHFYNYASLTNHDYMNELYQLCPDLCNEEINISD